MKRVGGIAYKLQLLKTLKIHLVFYVLLLKSYTAPGKVQPTLQPILEEDYELGASIIQRTTLDPCRGLGA